MAGAVQLPAEKGKAGKATMDVKHSQTKNDLGMWLPESPVTEVWPSLNITISFLKVSELSLSPSCLSCLQATGKGTPGMFIACHHLSVKERFQG